MLRWVIGLLLLANAGYFAWSQGYLREAGFAPTEQHEPERLQAQIQPEAIRLLNAPRADRAPAPVPAPAPAPAAPKPAPDLADAPAAPPAGTRAPEASPPPPATQAGTSAAPAPDPAPERAPEPTAAAQPLESTSCWQAGAFTETQADTLRAALSLLDLPRGSWQLNESRSGGRWIVYMGRYDNTEQLDRKKAELRALNVAFREVSGAGLSPGLALGTYSSEAAAEQALEDVVRAGVRTARVAQERAESRNFTLRLPAVTTAQRSAVAALGGALAGRSLQRCR